jgi:DNA-binding transcriptional LysR family regulator
MNNLKLNQIPLKTLPVFMTVAKHLSFSKAAKELCVTHSAVSQNIKQLEIYLNTILFKLQHRSIELTKTGQRFLKKIGEGLNIIYDVVEKEKTHNKNINLTVNIPSTLTSKCIIPELHEFQNKHPEIALQLSGALH